MHGALVGVRLIVRGEVHPAVEGEVIKYVSLETADWQLEIGGGGHGEMAVSGVPVVAIPILHVEGQNSVAL